MSLSAKVISVAARGSLLSRAQVDEVFCLIKKHVPEIIFSSFWIDTTGDLDQTTSLLTLEKTDFFTKEVDEAVLSGRCKIAIHSAKDLPEDMPEELIVVAYTKGVDPSDVLVFRDRENLHSLPSTPKIGTSSIRRKANLRLLLPHCVTVDIRGPIEKRLQLLDEGKIDALIVARAALIRLKLERECMVLPGDIAPLQGKLAIVARQKDTEMKAIFSHLHESV